MSRALKVGALFAPPRRRWPEGAAFAYFSGGYELLLRFESPTAAEIAAVERGPASLGALLYGAALLVVYRFGAPAAPEGTRDPIAWSDVPNHVGLVLEAQRELPPRDEDQAVLRIVLVDASTGIIRALRVVLLAPGFTAYLCDALHQQAAEPFAARDFERDVAEAEAAMDCEAMSRASPVLTWLAEKLPGARARGES